MTNEFSDELISAYLDGELDGDDKSRVEELLMDSVQHRQMFKELRALRDSLKSLPQYTLGGDFADKVVRQTEQVMTVPTTPTEVRPAKDSPVNRPVTNRGVVWAMVAVAASLLIAIAYPSLNKLLQNNNPEIANVDPADGDIVSESLDAKDGMMTGGGTSAGLESTTADFSADDPVIEDSIISPQTSLAPNAAQSNRHDSAVPLLPVEKDSPYKLSDAERRAAVSAPADAPHDDASYATEFGIPTGSPLYVYVDVPQAELAKHVIDSSLAANGIAMIDGRDQLASSFDVSGKKLAEQAAVELALRTNEAASSRERKEKSEGDARPMLASTGGDMLLVRATSRQIELTCNHLKARGYAVSFAGSEGGKSLEKRDSGFGNQAGGSLLGPAADKVQSSKDGDSEPARGRDLNANPTAQLKGEAQVEEKSLAPEPQRAKSNVDKKYFPGAQDKSDSKSDQDKNAEILNKDRSDKKSADEPASEGDAAGGAAPSQKSYAFRLAPPTARREVETFKRDLAERPDDESPPAGRGGSRSTSATEAEPMTVQVIFVIRPIVSSFGDAKAVEQPQPAAKND